MNILYLFEIICAEVIKIIPICDEDCKKNILLAKYHNTSLNDSNFCVNKIDIRTNQKCVSPPRIVIPTVEKETEIKNPLNVVQLPQIKHLNKEYKQDKRPTVTMYVTKNVFRNPSTTIKTPAMATSTQLPVQSSLKTIYIPQTTNLERKDSILTHSHPPSAQTPVQIKLQSTNIDSNNLKLSPSTKLIDTGQSNQALRKQIPVFLQPAQPMGIAQSMMAVQPRIIQSGFKAPVTMTVSEAPLTVSIAQQEQSQILVQPVQPMTIQKPVQTHMLMQPIQPPPLQHQIISQVVEQPVQHMTLQQPVQSNILVQPIQSPPTQHMIVSQVVQQLAQPLTIQQPIVSQVVQQPVLSQTIQQQIKPQVFYKPMPSQEIPQIAKTSQGNDRHITKEKEKIENPENKGEIKTPITEVKPNKKIEKIIINKEPVHLEKKPNNITQFTVEKPLPQMVNQQIVPQISQPFNGYNMSYTIPYNNPLCLMGNMICTPQSMVGNPYYPFYRAYFGPLFDIYPPKDLPRYCQNESLQPDNKQNKKDKCDEDSDHKESSSCEDTCSSDQDFENANTENSCEPQKKKCKRRKHQKFQKEVKELKNKEEPEIGEEINDQNKYSGIKDAFYVTILKDGSSIDGQKIDPQATHDVKIVTIEDQEDTTNDSKEIDCENETYINCCTMNVPQNDLQYIKSLSENNIPEENIPHDQREVQILEPHNINKYLYHSIYKQPQDKNSKKERKAHAKEKAKKMKERINNLLEIKQNDEALKDAVFGDFLKNRNVVGSGQPRKQKNIIELSDSFHAFIPEKQESESSTSDNEDQVVFLSELLQ